MKLNLALQGGGAHGAFTWGVVDRILEVEGVEITGISGTSAGAMNAAAIKCGWVKNGAEGAREALRDYWKSISRYSSPIPDYSEEMFAMAGPFAGIMKESFQSLGLTPNLESLDAMYSPYKNNPFDINVLRDVVNREFHNECLSSEKGPQLFINATNVRTGKIKVFGGSELSTDALLASAALPSIFKAVEIDGEAYWDGGFTGNPALFPLIDKTDCGDILIVHINPLERDEIPQTPSDIENRVNEISFNTSLLRELRHIHFINRLLEKEKLSIGKFKALHIHSIADDDMMNELTPVTKVFADQRLIEKLFERGRQAAENFIDTHKEKVGNTSSCDLREIFN